MVGNKRMTRWLVGAVILAVAECAAVVALDVSLTNPAQAQFFGDDRYGGRHDDLHPKAVAEQQLPPLVSRSDSVEDAPE